MTRHAIARSVVAVFALAYAATPALAQTTPAENSGGAVFLLYCSSCHGPNAKGDGPTAVAMQPKPPDLTKIAARNGGTFSDDIVFRTIDGRNPKAGHGGQGMPVWGDAFGRMGQTPEDTRRRIDAVVQYLKSIQAK